MQYLTPRETLFRKLHGYFLRERMPRLMMLGIVLLTGLFGFFCNRWLLGAGLENMAVRYPLGVFAGWLAFIGQVRMWVALEHWRFKSVQDAEKLPAGPGEEPKGDSSGPEWIGDSVVEAASHGAEGGCGGIVLAVVVSFIFGSVILAALSTFWAAPALIAEALLDVIIATTIAKDLRYHDSQWWADGVVRRTWKVAIGLAFVLAVLGGVLQACYPIKSLGDLFH